MPLGRVGRFTARAMSGSHARAATPGPAPQGLQVGSKIKSESHFKPCGVPFRTVDSERRALRTGS